MKIFDVVKPNLLLLAGLLAVIVGVVIWQISGDFSSAAWGFLGGISAIIGNAIYKLLDEKPGKSELLQAYERLNDTLNRVIDKCTCGAAGSSDDN